MERSKNKYTFPVKIKCKLDYTSSPAHVGRLKHSVDFMVPVGTQVFAALEGLVVDVKQNSSIGGDTKDFDSVGNYIEIKHANFEYSIYEHIRKNGSVVKVGDNVKKGQLIGYSGATGWLGGLGPHMHFNVHRYVGKGPEDYKSIEIIWA